MLSCISPREGRVADQISCKNARKAAVDAFFGHEASPLRERRNTMEPYSYSDLESIGLDFWNGSLAAKLDTVAVDRPHTWQPT